MAGSVWRKLIDAQKHCRCQPSHCQTVDAVLFFDCSFFDFPSMLFSIVRLFDCAWRCSAEWGYYEAEKDMSWWCSSSIWAVCKLHMRIAHVKSNNGWGVRVLRSITCFSLSLSRSLSPSLSLSISFSLSLSLSVCVCMYVYILSYIYIYIYTHRERDR